MVFKPDALREARLKAGLTQEDLASRSGVAANTIWHLEAGRSLTPRTGTLNKLAEALRVDWVIFFDQAPRKLKRASRPA